MNKDMRHPFLRESAKVRAEATAILQLTKIERQLAAYGDVHLIGSYAYDVMVAKDIDFHVVVKVLDLDLMKRFFDYAVESRQFEYISLHDKHHFNKEAAARYPSHWALDAYYFALRLPFNGHEWQIGVNFITKPQEAAVEIGHLFTRVTDDQREQILSFKKTLEELQIKVSSAYVYRAVIERDIRDFEDLRAYLSTLGYAV